MGGISLHITPESILLGDYNMPVTFEHLFPGLYLEAVGSWTGSRTFVVKKLVLD